jgi:hypothetical protein
MENTEIFVLTGIICTLFALFIIGPLFYAHQISQSRTEAEIKSTRKNGGQQKKAETLQHFYQGILSEPSLSKKEKTTLAKIMNRTIADMDSDGVYFPEALQDIDASNKGKKNDTDINQ